MSQKSWATRGGSTCSIMCRLWAAELCTQSLAPPHTAHFVFSALCFLLLPEHLWWCEASHPAWENCIGENNSWRQKRDVLVWVRLSSAWHWAFPPLGFADSLSLYRLQNHRDLLLDMESILPLTAGLAPVLRSAAALSRWHLKICKVWKLLGLSGLPSALPSE